MSQQLSPDPALVRLYQKPGLPFVFCSTAASAGVALTLLGPACYHVDLFLKALELLCGAGTLQSVTASDFQSNPVDLSFGAKADMTPLLSTTTIIHLHESHFSSCTRIRLTVASPLRLVRDGHELRRLDPVFMIRSFLRRLSALIAYYGEQNEPDLFRTLADLAGTVCQVKNSTQLSAGVRGISGSCELTGPFVELGPYLALGSLFHLGKGASFGNGCFTIDPIS